jgi:hypothetical protein
MSETVSSDFSITIREFDILKTAVEARQRKLRGDAKICQKSYTGKVTTAMKITEYLDEADELGNLLSKIAQEFS